MPDATPDTTPESPAPADAPATTSANGSTTAPATPPPGNLLERLFAIHGRGSTVGQEVRGGFATFFTMAYIVVLNPLILGFVKDADGQYLGGGSSPNLAAIAAGTALVAGIMTILMGVFANYPLALAGVSLSSFDRRVPGAAIGRVAREEIVQPRVIKRVVGGKSPDPREAPDVDRKFVLRG